MYLLKAVFFVALAIGAWFAAPFIGILVLTVGAILFIRAVLKEDANEQS